MKLRLFGIPVHVNPLFFITAVVIGLPGVDESNMHWIAIWVAIVFAGVLLHELGHAFMGRAFGLAPNIELYMLGGLTWWEAGRGLSPRRSILVSVAGPAVGIVIGLVCAFALYRAEPRFGHPLTLQFWGQLFTVYRLPDVGMYALHSAAFVNLGWGVLNLAPLLPLDGGNVLASSLELLDRERGRRMARYVSMFVAAGLAAWALAEGYIFGALLAGLLGFNNWRGLQAEKKIRRDLPLREDLFKAYRALTEADGVTVGAAARRVTDGAATRGMALEGQRLGAWGRLLRGEGRGEQQELEQLAGQLDDPVLQGALALAADDAEGALRCFEVAFEDEPTAGDLARLVAAFRATGRYDVAVAFVDSKAARQVPPQAIARLAEAAREDEYPEEAERLESLARA